LLRLLGGLAAGALVLFAAAAPALAGYVSPELESVLARSGPDEEVPVILHMSSKADVKAPAAGGRAERRAGIIRRLRNNAAASQADILRLLAAHRGVRKVVPLWVSNRIAARVPAAMAAMLAARSGVERVRLDAEIRLPRELLPADGGGGASTPEWNLDAIGAPALWALGHNGAGVVVAVMDTGVDALHPDIGPKYRGGSNSWFDPSGEHATPYDAKGHGTWVTGVLVGGDAGGSAIGVAPGAQWIAVKIFNDSHTASFSAIHQGFQWLLDPDGDPGTDDAPDIVNNSWYIQGGDPCDLEFEDDIAALAQAGISVVFSAGNTGPAPDSSVSPADNPGSLAVGAVGPGSEGLVVADFSGRGPSSCGGGTYPRLVAPGVGVRTADRTLGGIFPNSYAAVSGTSFSAPHVAGGLALLKSAFGNATAAELLSAIEAGAADMEPAGPDNDSGYGLLDLLAAYEALSAPPSPDSEPDGDVDGVDLSVYTGAFPSGLGLAGFALSFGSAAYP
jgi:bacillopeptidase F